MLIGLAGGALWALDTVILGMALALPVFTGDPRAAILAPFASTFLHDLCSSLWMLGYTGLRRQYKAVWQALRTRGGAAKGTSTGLWLRAAVLYRLGSGGGHLHLRTAKQHRHQRPGAANPPAGVGADLCHCFAARLQGLGLYHRAV